MTMDTGFGSIAVGEVTFYEVHVDRLRHVVRIVRSDAQFTDLSQLEAAFAELHRSLRGLDRSRHVLLIDLRRGPGRNDPAFEAAIGPLRVALCAGFARVATLVASAIGRLQVQRHILQDGTSDVAFTNEDDAVRYLEDAFADTPRHDVEPR